MATKRIPIPKISNMGQKNTTDPLDKILKGLDKTRIHMGKKSKVAMAPEPIKEIKVPKAHWRPVQITAEVEFELSAKRPRENTK